MLIEFTDSNFEELVLKSDKPVLVDFWAEWCGPCRMITPLIKDMAETFSGNAVIGKLDVDSNPGVSSKFGIRSIPTLLYFKDGKQVDKQVGVTSKANLSSKLEKLL